MGPQRPAAVCALVACALAACARADGPPASSPAAPSPPAPSTAAPSPPAPGPPAGVHEPAPAPVLASTPTEIKGAGMTKFQRRRLIGHYSTPDGKSGFILDRSGDRVKAKLDGGSVQVLDEEHGPFDTKHYRSLDKAIWLRLSKDGDVLLFQGPKQTEGVTVVRDADADPLP